ncbi:hypothetical protein WA026_009459 [Henosepilachna vigintioctopunctata]|uniref:Uncharacterized protein n=1 Tax=Henosepilachna vigintioctopunctata TaxID=420089 RepID=A0AAW1TZF3_9CUCU
MKNIKNFIFIGSNNLSKLLTEINQISTIKVTIYKESSKKTFIILPHLASGKKSSGREIKITITDKEELGEFLNGISIVSRRKMEKELEIVNAETNLNQKEVIILKSPPLCGKMFEFLTETQGLFSNESSNLCAAIQRNRFYASDGQIANSMHVLPISQFSRDVLVTGGSSLFPKLTGSDQEAAHLNSEQHNGIKDPTEDNDDHLHKKSKLDKRMSEFETCLSEIFYDTINKEVILVEHTKRTKNSKSSPAVVEVHEFRSNDQPRVKKSRVLVVSESRFKKLENSFVKFQAKKKIRNLEPLLTEFDNKNEIMEKLEDKFVDKFRQMQNTYKKKNLIVMNFDLPGRLTDEFLVDVNGSKFENSLMSSKTYIDALKTSFDIAKKRKNRGNLVVVNDQIFKTSTCPIINAQNKHFLGDDNKALVFLNNAIYKELEKETMFSILNRKYSTGKNKARKTSKSNPVSATDKKSPKKNQESSKVQLSGYSEIPLDNLIAAVAEKKRIEYASRSKIVLEVYEHYEKILENTKILNPPDGNNWKNIDMKNNSLSKVFRGGTGHKVPKIDRSKGVAPREIFTKEVKTDENINRNKSECSKVFKGESASTRTILPYDNTKTAPKGFNTEEMRANENIDQNEYDFSTLFKGESTIAPTGIDLSHEKNEIAPTDISTKEVKANKNINRNEYDLPKVFKGEYVIRTSEIDLPYAKIDKVPRKVSTKETKDNKTVNQNRHDLLEVIKSKSATKFPAVDLTHEKNEITVRKVSTKEAKSNRNIDQNEHDLPQVIKTKSAIRPSKDVPYEKNQTLPRKVSTKEVKSSRNIDQIKHDLPQVIKTKSVCRPPAVNQSHEKKEMIPRKISTKEVEATKNTDHNKHDLSNPIRVESSTRPITTDLPHEQKEIALKEISNKKEKAREYIDRNEADPSEVVEKESASRSSAIDPLNAENNITSIQDSTIRKRDKNFDQNECDLPKICKTECDNKIAEVDSPNEENEMANEEMKNKEKGDEMNAAKVDCQSPTLKAEVQHVNLVQQVVSVKSKIPVKALSTPKSNASVEGAENDDIQQNWLQNDEKFIDSKLKIIQDEHTSKETVKEMTSTTAKNIHKVTINEKSSTIKSRLPRLSKPIKHTISKDNNETFLKIPKAEDQQMKNQEDSLVSKKKTGSSKEIEEFIDLKKVINPNRFFADVHRLIFSEQDEGEMELFSRKIAPNKFQLQFLQNVLKRPAESTYQPAKSNDEDCEAVVKRMVTQIENEESAFHLKIAKREPGTFVIIDPPKNEETVVGQNDSLTSKSNYSMDSQKKTSTKTSLPEGKELPLQTQIISHLEKFPVLEKSLDEIQEKKIIDEQYSHPPKNSVVSNQNEIGENNNIDIEEKGRSNILKNVTDVEQGVKQIEANVKTKETKQSQEKQENASSKSVPQANKNHYGGDDTSRGGVDLSDKIKNNKDPQQTTVKSENVSKNETLHLEEKFEAKKKPLTTIKKKIFTNAKGIIDKTGLGENGDIESKITIENRKINNEIFKGEKMHRMKVQGKIVNAKEKVNTDGKKKQQKEENIQLAKNKTRLESGKLPNEVGPKSDVINAANNIEENAESSVQEKQKPITEKIEKFGRNEETISQHQSEMKKSCETEEKLKLLKIVSENVIKKKGTTDEPNEFLQKSKPMDQQSVETEHEKRNVTLKETSECLDGIPSKIVEIRDEERKIIIENIEAKNTQSELEEGSSFHKSDTLADNSSSNIGNLKEEPGTQNKIMKREQDSGKGKNNEVSSSEVSGLKKTDVATEIPTDVKQTQFPIDKSDQNVECHLTVVENERRDVTEKSSDFKAKLEELPKTSNSTEETSGNIDEKKLESTDKVKEIVHKPKDVKASMKKTTKGKESSVLKCQCHNDNIPKDVSKKSASENVIIIKAAKKDSEETVESVLGITKPFLEQIQSKMLNFVTKKTKSKAKIRNFSFRSHAVKKCKEITALLKHSQEKLFEDNTAGLANICQHAKMINRFSRTKLPPKRLNGATPKTGNTFGTNATDKPKQPQDKKVKKKATPTEELVKSTIETKVASKMKSLAKSPNDGKKSVTVKIIKPPQTPVNQSDVKQSTKLDENKDLFNSSDSITDLGKDSIGSIFAEVVASAMIKCGKVEQSSVQRSDSQDEFANIMNMAQDIKQKLGQVEVTEIEEDVEIENNTMKEIKKPDEFIIEGNDLRKLGLNVKFDENRARCSGDKYKCTISLILDKKAKEEDVMLLKSETPVVVRPDDDKTSAESSVPLTIEVTEKSEEKQIEIPIKQILTMDDKTKTVNFKVSPQVEVNVINDCNADKTKIDENNGRENSKLLYSIKVIN